MGEIEDYLYKLKTGVVIVPGTGRSGKTGMAWHCMTDPDIWGLREKSMFGYPEDLLATEVVGSDKFRAVYALDDVQNGSICFMDDTALFLLARKYGDKFNQTFSAWVTIISHKDVLLLMTIQSLSLVDIATFKAQEIIFIQKFMDWDTLKTEREEYRAKLLLGNLAILDHVETFGVSRQSVAYVHKLGECWETPLVSFWNDSFSKPYANLKVGGGRVGSNSS